MTQRAQLAVAAALTDQIAAIEERRESAREARYQRRMRDRTPDVDYRPIAASMLPQIVAYYADTAETLATRRLLLDADTVAFAPKWKEMSRG
jgi:hypothetical protein